MRVKLILALVLSLISSGVLAGGVEGLVSFEGKNIAGVTVRAFAHIPGSFGPDSGQPPVKSVLSGPDGSAKLELPDGRYVIDGIKKNKGNSGSVEEGDLYSIFLGSPVTVQKGKFTQAGLNLARAGAQKTKKGGKTAVKGVLTHKGKPAQKAYLFFYSSPDSSFRGQADITAPVASGNFSVAVKPGKYYLVARKRAKGGTSGPLEKGDLFNYYAKNPVTVAEGEEIEVEIPLVQRLDELEGGATSSKGVKILVTDSKGAPLKGFYVMAYPSAERSGHPALSAGPTDEKGELFLNLSEGGKYLRARKSMGGPLEEGEKFADATFEGGAVTIKVK